MSTEDDDDFLDGDDLNLTEYAPEIFADSTGLVTRRRIELLKEKMWLKNQMSDFSDWND